MQNETRVHTRRVRDLLQINSPFTFHQYLFDQAFARYGEIVGEGNWGSALAICSEYNEPQMIPAHPFSEIVLTGFGDQAEDVARYCEYDPRVSYECQNAECLPYDSGSFDVVVCKEGLHHLARPILGVYEMLRIARKAVVIIEPYQTFFGNLLEQFGLASVYERNYDRNINYRDNYVFRFDRKMLESILNSYYIDSAYQLELYVGWMRWNVTGSSKWPIRLAGAFGGRCVSMLPGSRGNYMTAIIQPGSDLPSDPEPFQVPEAVLQQAGHTP